MVHPSMSGPVTSESTPSEAQMKVCPSSDNKIPSSEETPEYEST